MGNKHALAPEVVRLSTEAPVDAPLIDLFCGMCSIGRAFAPTRRAVWGNDVQQYAGLAARCHLAAEVQPLRSGDLARLLLADCGCNTEALERRFEAQLRLEKSVLADPDRTAYVKAQAEWRHAANDPDVADEVRRLAADREPPDRLFTLTFAWGYFGLVQAVAIDSIRHAIARARDRRELSSGQADWALLALLEAVSICASTPGHFAQFLRGQSDAGYVRVRRQRRRDLWSEFLRAADLQQAFGSRAWRRTNAVMTADALTLWDQLDQRHTGHAIVYADPPYSKDHYSRYYHVLETLILYDYPDAIGAGRYRPSRFVTPFSVKRGAGGAFTKLFSHVVERQWTLILSYPSNGLIAEEELGEQLVRHFGDVRLAVRYPIAHSTLGARHGAGRSFTEELMWVAR